MALRRRGRTLSSVAGSEPSGGTWLRAGDPGLDPTSDPQRAAERLSGLIGTDPRVLRRRSLMLALLDRHGAVLADRRHAAAHLTASALVLDAERGQLVVLLHTKLRRWLQPGGHADGDMELAGVALREATEETGIEGMVVLEHPVDLDVHLVDHGDALGPHLHLDVRFVVLAPSGAELRGNHESQALRWVRADQLHLLTEEPSLDRLLRAGLSAAARHGAD